MELARIIRIGLAVCVGLAGPAAHAAASLSYRDLIAAPAAASLAVRLVRIDPTTGAVEISGGDSRRPDTPFRFDWGDGRTSHEFFPTAHTYKNHSRNYVVTVTATYGRGATDSAVVVVRFVPAVLGNYTVPADIAVSLPASLPPIGSTEPGYRPPAVLAFPDNALPREGRAVCERVLGAFAAIQQDLVNGDLARTDGTFRQVVALPAAATKPYAFSIWYSQPVMLVAQARALGGDPDWSTLAHEMGHNATLNTPAAYRLGGKIDGPANAIVSETLAQIFQHVTCHVLVNHATDYGIPDDLAAEIAQRARVSFAYLKSRNGNAPFASWNDPATPADETLPTFMTLAYQFFAAGDLDGADYRPATRRLMFFLQHWNRDWQARFSPRKNSPAAEAFRATLIVAAISYGTVHDLRPTFRALKFPVDDALYDELTATVGAYPGSSPPAP
jgi:hypothetical protein